MKVSLVQVEKPKRGKRGKKEEMITDPKGEDEVTSTVTPPGDNIKKLNITDHIKQYAPGGAEMTFEPEKDKAAEMRMSLEKAIEKDAYTQKAAEIEATQNPIPAALQAPYINGTYDEAVLESALNRIIQRNKMFEKEKYAELKKKSLEKIAQLLGVQSTFTSGGSGEITESGSGAMAGNSTAIGEDMSESFVPTSESSSTAVGGEVTAPIPTPVRDSAPIPPIADFIPMKGASPFGIFF
jgi:hypothetical protein